MLHIKKSNLAIKNKTEMWSLPGKDPWSTAKPRTVVKFVLQKYVALAKCEEDNDWAGDNPIKEA